MIVPFIAPVRKLRPIYRWENKALTGGLASVSYTNLASIIHCFCVYN